MLFRKDTADSALDPQIAALLRSRQAMFSETPSVLPDLHRRLRASAMRRVSVREALVARVSNWIEEHLALQSGLRYAGAAALLAAAVVVGLNQASLGENAGAPMLTLKSEAASAVSPTLALATPGGRVDYAMNDAQPSMVAASLTLDQQIDRSTVGGDLNPTPANAQYILPKAPSTYDSVVAF
ncbi:hypothetical protein SAMN05444156_1484 [Verrucomicrobium sp. GAS474]|uniref:hypothetical protein n=1 Tax=Verrucomicrobium sp. GAS474 TaxID=1882831 RepID=UPI00087BEF1D|nr:hypothetical protein [Verrucomicrobium sp. GAS474]SDU02046.1 hypothetical protein SAMN05444156_1484 [Verrucomicrobium sp. GAS474]